MISRALLRASRLVAQTTITLAAALWFSSSARAGVISIVIDDIGYSHTQGWMAIALPNSVTLSILPDAPYGEYLGEQADIAGHETMLHLPMQAIGSAPQEMHTLNTGMDESQLKKSVRDYLLRFPYVSGLNNHMGSQLTASSIHMSWLMESIENKPGLYFVDSRTTTETQAQFQAVAHEIPTSRRDVFLDNSTSPDAILEQLEQLKTLSRRNGFALGIAHPHKSTLDILRKELPKLEAEGLELVPVSEYIRRQSLEAKPWLLSSYPSPRAVKN